MFNIRLGRVVRVLGIVNGKSLVKIIAERTVDEILDFPVSLHVHVNIHQDSLFHSTHFMKVQSFIASAGYAVQSSTSAGFPLCLTLIIFPIMHILSPSA